MSRLRQYGYFLLLSFYSLLTITITQLASAQKFGYKVPDDILVQQKLKEWGQLKFGLMITWGIYSQWDIMEMV